MHSEESIILLIKKKLAVTFQTDVYLYLCSQNNLKLMRCGRGRYKDYGAQLGLFVGPTHCRLRAAAGPATWQDTAGPAVWVKPWPTGVSVSAER